MKSIAAIWRSRLVPELDPFNLTCVDLIFPIRRLTDEILLSGLWEKFVAS